MSARQFSTDRLDSTDRLHSTDSRIHSTGRHYSTDRPYSTDRQDSTVIDSKLTHVDSTGKASMVNVGHKNMTKRTALASGKIYLGEEVFKLVENNQMRKGDVLTVSQIAGVMGVKQTSNLIPLCHPLNLDKIDIKLRLDQSDFSVLVSACVECSGKTGVEMEALTGVSVTLLTVYDMCKAVTKDMVIGDIKLVIKTGGKSDYENISL